MPDLEGMAEGAQAESAHQRRYTMLTSVASDVHFWVPTLVLMAGLLLLRWVS